MPTSDDIRSRLDRVLLTVQKPGRYVGGEFNQIVKIWDSVKTHVALIFPDIYDIGLPNLGMAILYDQINLRSDSLAERSYSPWLDMEAAMRDNGIPLFSLESKHSLIDFDILGFSLPYETLYTNVLNALDLAELPLLSSERSFDHPLVIAGGHAAFNPEPMADFIDAFAIGEGEDVIHEIIATHQAWKSSGLDRHMLLENLALIPGVYVPSFYQVDYHPDGMVKTIKPQSPIAQFPVKKRLVAQLPPPVTRFLVPNIDVVHNRVVVEITRGCTRGCRFCHAGIITRPVRERPVGEIVSAVEEALRITGYEEVALLSLSSSDYTNILDLVQEISRRFTGRQITVSLPSLRIDSFSVQLMESLNTLRPGGGFTVAPEAATDRMRRIINKPVSTDQLLETARAVFSHGWKSMKLYFMIGHPSETMEDVQAIADICKDVLAVGRRLAGGRARVHAGISTFIPKAHTPFQWVACDSINSVQAKIDFLKKELRNPALKLSWSETESTQLESWLSRGDRRLGKVILAAWLAGCKFDAWTEQLRFGDWLRAFEVNGLNPAFYSVRTRELDETLPWQHISSGVSKKYLQQEYEWSLDGKLREDCRQKCFSCGILPGFNELRKSVPDEAWKCPPVKPHREKATV